MSVPEQKPLTEMTELRWLSSARVWLVGAAILFAGILALVNDSQSSTRALSVCLPLVLLYAAAVLAQNKRPQNFQRIQFTIDSLVITGVIYLTGGPSSPFLFLYLPVVMIASVLTSREWALIVAAQSAGTYTTLALCMQFGILGAIDAEIGVQIPTGGLIPQIVALTSALVLTAVAAAYLVRQLRSSGTLIEQSKLALAALSDQQRALMEGLPEGVISTDTKLNIVSFNPAITQLFSLGDNVIGKPLVQTLLERGVHIENNASVFRAQDAVNGKKEVLASELELKASETKLKLSCGRKPLISETGETLGYLFVFQDVTRLRSIEARLETQERMARLLAEKNAPVGTVSTRLKEFVGESLIMQKVFRLIDRVGQSDATILISGESGTGKELVARAIHLGSGRASLPFVPVNCGAIPENLIESEFFGHKKGAFTGADNDHMGLFRRAEGGTIFLDEIGELPLHMQAKLLRALQDRRVRPVGSDRDIPINIRIIAASNRNLKVEVEHGRFRDDLFYRLNVINIHLPPLRERKEDIPLLVNSILKRYVEVDVTPVVSPSAMDLLTNYNYPGNVRELENILERAVVLSGEVILPEHLQDLGAKEGTPHAAKRETEIVELDAMEFPVDLDKILGDLERKYLELALMQTSGAKKKAAELLGMNFRSFRYRLQKFGLGDDQDQR